MSLSRSTKPLMRVCAPSPAVEFDTAAACQPALANTLSPIDEYYDAAESITVLGTAEQLVASEELGRLILLGHVSAVETYVRGALVRLIGVCDATRAHAGSQQLALSSIYYYKSEDVALGLFDRISLAGYDEIKKAVKRVADFDIREVSSLGTTLKKFDDLCHLRHAAVHAHGTISSAGAAAIGIGASNERFRVVIDFPRAQEVAAVCRATVQELNEFLFSAAVESWRRKRLLTGDYDLEGERFRQLLRAFWSVRDSTKRRLPARVMFDAACSTSGESRRPAREAQ